MNLFAKIFLGFWLSTIAIVGSWLLASRYFDPYTEQVGEPRDAAYAPRGEFQPPGPLPPGRQAVPPLRNMFRIYYGLQNVSAGELPGWIAQQEKREDIQIFLVDQSGTEIFGRDLLPGTERILARLSGFRRRATHREGKVVLYGQELYRPEWGALNMVIARHPPASPIVKLLTEHLWLRLLLALLISGAISYAVSRYLTRPLKDLRLASRELASGNLATRIDVSARGGDEADELARDFNSMAAQLEEKIQAQKRLLNDVSHELRSPLARLRVALALAEQKPERTAEQLRRIELETERLDELIGQLLSVPDGAQQMEDSIDLVALLQALCEDANYEAQAAGKSVQLNSRMTSTVVRTHGDLLKKALENVIRNAVQYTAPNTAVQVSLERRDDGLEIRVEDAGPGIPETELERVFEPFYRIDEARQRETGGYGLGLSIARRAIARHRGVISAANTGSGLCVRIRLPLPAAEDS